MEIRSSWRLRREMAESEVFDARRPDSARLAVDLTGQLAFDPEALPFVLDAVVVDPRMIWVRPDLEAEEVSQVGSSRVL
jgi:hypothetical protein